MWLPALGVIACAALIFVASLVGRANRRSRRLSQYKHAKASFRGAREHLEAKFFSIAAQSGKPRGLEWVDCEFATPIVFARDRVSGQVTGLVEVTIRFAAIVGGDMEEVEAVGNLRAATAVFSYINGRWQTEGRAIFNLNPDQAIAHFRQSLEVISE